MKNVASIFIVALALSGCQTTGGDKIGTSSKIAEKGGVMQTKPFTKSFFDEVVKGAPKGDKFTTRAEQNSLVASYLKNLNTVAYEMEIKIDNYNASSGYYPLMQNINNKRISETNYESQNANGAKVIVNKTEDLTDSLFFDKNFLKVSGQEARDIEGKKGIVKFKELKPSAILGGEICGKRHSKPRYQFPYEMIKTGCILEAEIISITVDGKEMSATRVP